jgi:hypothetical protein
MEEVLAFFGFALGASLGAGLVRSIAGGPRVMLRRALTTGIRTWDGLSSVTAGGRQGLADVHAEVRAERSTGSARRPRRTSARKITIARE